MIQEPDEIPMEKQLTMEKRSTSTYLKKTFPMQTNA